MASQVLGKLNVGAAGSSLRRGRLLLVAALLGLALVASALWLNSSGQTHAGATPLRVATGSFTGDASDDRQAQERRDLEEQGATQRAHARTNVEPAEHLTCHVYP